MITTKKTKIFITTFSISFILSLFFLRGIFEKADWSESLSVSISLMISGLFAATVSQYLINKEKRGFGFVFSVVYFFILLSLFFFLKDQREGNESLLQGSWETKESDGENFIMEFVKDNSLKLLIPPDDERIVTYVWKDDKFLIFDDEKNLLFNWIIEKKDNELILRQDNDKLIFYRN